MPATVSAASTISTATIVPDDSGELRGTPIAFCVPDFGPDGWLTDDGVGVAAAPPVLVPVLVLGCAGCVAEREVLRLVEVAGCEGAREELAGVVALPEPAGAPLPRPFAPPLFGALPVPPPGALPVAVREPELAGALGWAGSLVVRVEDSGGVGCDDAELGGVGRLAVELAGGVEGGGVVAVEDCGSVGLVGTVGVELGWSPPPPWMPPPPFEVLLVVDGGTDVVVQVVGGALVALEVDGGVQVGPDVGQQSSPTPRCPGGVTIAFVIVG